MIWGKFNILLIFGNSDFERKEPSFEGSFLNINPNHTLIFSNWELI